MEFRFEYTLKMVRRI